VQSTLAPNPSFAKLFQFFQLAVCVVWSDRVSNASDCFSASWRIAMTAIVCGAGVEKEAGHQLLI